MTISVMHFKRDTLLAEECGVIITSSLRE